MTEIQISELIDHLSSKMTQALEMAVQDAIPGADFNSHILFRAFSYAVRRTCNPWELIPNTYVIKHKDF
jgi:hypothetical protein